MMRGTNQTILLLVLMGIVFLPSPGVFAGPTSPIVNDSTATFTGDQSAGIWPASTWSCPPVYTYNVNALIADIAPVAGTPGIRLTRAGANGANGASKDEWDVFGNGGNGGAGANGGALVGTGFETTFQGPVVDFTGGGYEIVTTGAGAFGIGAISTGGKGGNGGNRTGFLWGTFAAIGGAGGDGGMGFPATVISDGSIYTDGASSDGILAKSQGGDGGNGGWGDGNILGSGGGPGGKGGFAAGATVTSHGSISTNGDNSPGIRVLSQGGDGGDGGAGLGGAVAVGARGEDAGNAGPAQVTNDAGIHTHGDASPGIFALSQGGEGGKGGNASAVGSGAGNGGSGGNAGAVVVTNDGNIETEGDYGDGIVASSLGGAAGGGGTAGGVVFGSPGITYNTGVGGPVTVANTGSILTSGTDARGIFAQSVGGFAGDAGDAASLLVSVAGLGVSDNSGGDGGSVTVTNSGAIRTEGDTSQRVGGAIVARSIGGGGGDAGSVTGMIAIGGDGSAGGNGGDVTVINSGQLQTAGRNSSGILAESIGGGGGDGSSSTGVGVEFAVTLGGNAGAGGSGGEVGVASNETSIATAGDGSYGIHAMSIGGGGGNGGSSINAAYGVDFTAGLALGGRGGAGGDGGLVDLSSGSLITTQGDNAHGISAQSIGGGGGSGGSALSWVFNLGVGLLPGVPTMSAVVAIGGAGGDGGSSNTVHVGSTGNISTSGFRSYGILAQAVGGGGGDGGNSMASSLFLSTDVTVDLAVGGKGGVAGGGATVEVDSDSRIETQGDFSHGILAQSIGGGGGAGGNSSVLTEAWDFPTGPSPEDLMPRAVAANVVIGGAGGTGAGGGLVDVLSTGDISTMGDFANGILAQSIGGGGGDGGSSTEISREFSAHPLSGLGVQADILIGGFAPLSGGAGTVNNGGQVKVHNDGIIATAGAFANGILAQSIGGGGGAGGDTTKSTLEVSADFVGAILPSTGTSPSVSLGGWGGMGGAGGRVIVENDGDIMTAGHFANGILAQSVGGGGGAGGASTKFAIELGLIPPGGLLSDVGGSAELSVGGFGGLGGAGGLVTVDNSGSIATAGHFANGILAQSIGGGGGAGGDLMSIDATMLGETLPPPGFDSSLSLGGYGGMGGAGGVVSVGNHGDIATAGDFANGILAQSIGGGGGTNGSVTTYSLALAGGEPSARSLKGASAGIGDGGAVSVDNSADIVTQGGFAHGILAQSIGGGGGFAGINGEGGVSTLDFSPEAKGVFVQGTDFGAGFAGSTGGSGSAGAVSVTHTGSITTYGEMSHGILAQSAAGSGTAGPVAVTLAGEITTHGANSDGIHAQSVGGSGRGNISISLAGIIRGGSGNGAGVNIDGGADNLLANTGSISALSGRAIVGSVGNDTINNNGAVTGSVLLGTGANAFNNNAGGVLNSGDLIDLGAGNALANAGILSPGGIGAVMDTTLIGDLVLSASGVLEIEIGGFTPGSFDSLDVTGSVMSEMSLLSLSSPMGGVNFSFLPGFDIASELGLGESITLEFLTAGSEVDWTMMSYSFSGGPWGFRYDVFGQDGGLFLQATHVTNTIPAPGAWVLGGLGLGLLGWGRRRMRW